MKAKEILKDGNFYYNSSGTNEVAGTSDWNGKIQIYSISAGDVLIYYEKDVHGLKALYGYHIKVKIPTDNTSDTISSTTKDVTDDTNWYKPTDIDNSSANKIETKTGKILTAISNIGIVASILIIAIIGIKYMIGSVEEKAEYKQDLIPYLVGAALLFGITTFVRILMALGNNIKNS